jgi:hypothetical protein
MSNNGIIWKNDVNARGSSVSFGPFLTTRKVCIICHKEISDFETVLYGFAGRGTQGATTAYCHKECEPKFAIPPEDNNRTKCYICGGNKQLDRAFRLNWNRVLRYHSDCLRVAKRDEVVPMEALKRMVRKRMIGRLKRPIWQEDPIWYAPKLKLLLIHGAVAEIWTRLIKALNKPPTDEEWLIHYQELETMVVERVFK